MKFKVLSRSEQEFTRDRKDALMKVQRIRDSNLHPFAQAREYTRALNAVKLDKIFAKPFIGALEGHMDGVYSMTNNRKSLVSFVSGSCDGEIRVWDLPTQKTLWSAIAHQGFVRGLAPLNQGTSFLSCGDDKTVKFWNFIPEQNEIIESDKGFGTVAGKVRMIIEPFKVLHSDYSVLNLDCHWERNCFATCGSYLDFWDVSRNEPIHRFTWGVDSINCVKFNPAEKDLLAASGSDRSISLYDVREKSALHKVILKMSSNSIAWNPMEPFKFVVGNEDHNCYTFDVRSLDKPMTLHRSHLGAVLSVSFSPTGREFASGSYDKTVRLYDVNSTTSKEVYHAKRMQRIFCVNYSQDSRFVLSGSDDTNIRIWKAKANDKLAIVNDREQRSLNYSERLVKKFRNVPEIRKISKHRHLPANLHKMNKRKHEMLHAQERRENNLIKHSGGKLLKVADKETVVVAEES